VGVAAEPPLPELEEVPTPELGKIYLFNFVTNEKKWVFS
jgi:hypothetical protein